MNLIRKINIIILGGYVKGNKSKNSREDWEGLQLWVVNDEVWEKCENSDRGKLD